MDKSYLSSFLYHLNKKQKQETFIQQDKLERIQFDIVKGLVDIEKFERFNNICDDLFGLIELYLRHHSTGKMTVKEVLKRMKVLRLTGSKIGKMDDSLRRLVDLEVLVLAGNCLLSCKGVSQGRTDCQ
ncbi:uncharacterized protein LOC129000589 [Macrosteles quadrilineatus]|uniref:uncharacterized protein LOC129000589 n=1 Tax=Macrosteles quadrilineatus TaxID=74068 RepID=UPI0023E2F7F2|nr:uncharacterized protein LOC129000589 [Macrosteles quadrilineatus]